MKKLSIIILFFISMTATFSQQVSYNEEFQVNTSSGSQISVCGLNNGGFIICWENYSDIFAQVFDVEGKKVGEEFLVNTYTNDYQSHPNVCLLKDGKFVIVWDSEYQDGSKKGIYAKVYNENGTIVKGEFQVNTYTNDTQIEPSITSLNNGGFVITWWSLNQDGSSFGIFAQIYNNSGNKIGNEFLVNTKTEGWQCNAKTVGLTDGGFVIYWKSETNDNGKWEKFIQKFDSIGVKLDSAILVNSSADYSSLQKADICGLSNDGLVICWEQEENIFVQVYDNNIQKVGAEIIVNDNQYYKEYPKVTELKKGRFIICWYESSIIDHVWRNRGIFAQILNVNGEKEGNYIRLDNSAHIRYNGHNLGTLQNGDFIFVYNSYGIFAKYYLSEPLNHNLIDFLLLQPDYDATSNNITPYFIWQSATTTHINFQWELTYDLFIDTDNSFPNPKIIRGIQDTIYHSDSLAPGQTYFWKVLAKNIAGDSLWSSNVNGFYVDPNATDVEVTETTVPEKYELYQNYPNPFNPSTKIKYSIPSNLAYRQAGGRRETSNVRLIIYDVLGKEIATLVNKEQAAGSYEVDFLANGLASGVYFYRLSTGSFVETKKMLLLR